MRDAARLVQATVGATVTSGNAITVLRNGDEIFPSMLEAIRQAEHSVLLSTYVYWSGEIAERMADALADRARAGVAVRVLVDWVGGRSMSEEIVARIVDAGGRFAWFRPPDRLARAASSMDDALVPKHRTHRKVLVCDGQVGFTGGVGIAEEWMGDARSPEEWRDTHVRFEGPAVASLVSAFGTNWYEATGAALPFELVPDCTPAGDSEVQVVRGQPGEFISDVGLVLRALMRAADTRIWVETAYFVPDEAITTLLGEAVRRGVDVRVVVPGPHIDKRVSWLAARASFDPLLDDGVAIFEFQPTMLHCKVVIVDGVAVVGSANLNMRSMGQDDEVIAVIHDSTIVDELASQLEGDLGRSERLEQGRFEERGLGERAAEAVVDTMRRFL